MKQLSEPSNGAQSDDFGNVTDWRDDTAALWIRRLEARDFEPAQYALRQRILDAAGVETGQTAVDIGCGTGAMLGDAVRRVGRTGSVIGIEPEPHLAERAREQNRSPLIDVLVGRGECLPLSSRSAHVILATTVFIHLADELVEAVIEEMSRVVSVGGRVVITDQDCDTWTIDHPDRELTRAIVRFNSDSRSADGWRGRQLRRSLTDAGLNPQVFPFTVVDPPTGGYLLGLAERICEAAAAAGQIGEGDTLRWLEHLLAAAEAGCFFSSIDYFICSGDH